MFPQLTPPTDSLYKFLAVGGLVLVVTVLYLQQRMQAELTSASFHVYEQQLGQAESEAQLDASHQRLMYALRSFYNKAGIDSEKEIDTTGSGALVWHRVTSGPKELVSESNALGDSLRKFLGHERLVQQKRNLFDLERSRYEAEKESARWIIDVLWFGLVFGFALSILGFLLWYKKIQRYNDQILRNEFEKVNREYYCQSCGMRLDMA
ncbi:MAG: hypothetical protein JNL05_14200 [Flavobacteriales bacterium]|nr:hypothetical protein [Flavobacteriales bacterium]